MISWSQYTKISIALHRFYKLMGYHSISELSIKDNYSHQLFDLRTKILLGGNVPYYYHTM